MPETDYQTLTQDVQELKEEQRRLREEQDFLRKQAEDSKKNGSKDGSSSSEKGEKSGNDDNSSNDGNNKDGEKKSQDQDGNIKKADQGQQKGKAEGEGGDEKKKEKEEPPKAPLKIRIRDYVQTHKTQVVIGAILFVIICIAAIFLILYIESYESTDDAEVDGHLDAVSSRINGTVEKVYIEDNQTVSEGQLLVDLDPRDFQTALEQANANHASAKAQLNAQDPNVPIVRTTNESTITTNQESVENATAAVQAAEKQYQSKLAAQQQAEANDAKAQRNLIRYRELAEKEEISREQFDNYTTTARDHAAAVIAARSVAEAAQKGIDQSRAQLSQVQARLNESKQNAPRNEMIQKAGVEARQAAVAVAQAQTDQAALNLSYTKIVAPAGGIVTSKSVEVGQRVEPGEQLLIVSQSDDIWITANFKETQLKKMHIGQRVDIRVDTFSRTYHGYIESMPGATGARTSLLPPENATGNFVKVVQRLPVRIRLDNDQNNDHLLRPGMSVEPKVWLK
jgi:membrane fusion protein (multidrug efflux system)